jgi:hypothetical protein
MEGQDRYVHCEKCKSLIDRSKGTYRLEKELRPTEQPNGLSYSDCYYCEECAQAKREDQHKIRAGAKRQLAAGIVILLAIAFFAEVLGWGKSEFGQTAAVLVGGFIAVWIIWHLSRGHGND